MCFVLYLASDTDLPVSEWSQAAPACYVGALRSDKAGVRRQFSKTHVRYIGSDTDCGCGFGLELRLEDYAEPDASNIQKSRRWLVALLRRLVDADGSVEVLSCEFGEEDEEQDERLHLTPEAFAEVALPSAFVVVSDAAPAR